MIILITGASHTGKTVLAQKLLEKYKYPYLSIDHLKMGLIRSKNTKLTPISEDYKLAEYLWPIVKEIIKTAIENKQNLIVEGCYVPLDWDMYFSAEYLENIKLICLVMTKNYIEKHTADIKRYSNVIESGLYDDLPDEVILKENEFYQKFLQNRRSKTIIIDDTYSVDVDDI